MGMSSVAVDPAGVIYVTGRSRQHAVPDRAGSSAYAQEPVTLRFPMPRAAPALA